MAKDWVSLGNSALIKLGAKIIASLDDPSKEARLIKARYEDVRDIVLRMHPWNSAMKRVVLAPLVTAPAFDFGQAFQLPSDCLRIVLIDPDNSTDYRVEQRMIVADASTLDLKYIYQVTDPTLLDSMLGEAIAAYLAFDIAYALMQSGALRDEMWKLFQSAVANAKSVNGKENPAQELLASAFLDSRIAGIGTISAGHFPR